LFTQVGYSGLETLRATQPNVIQTGISHDVGYRSYLGNAGFIWSHGCASDVHTSICRLNQLGSSKLATLIPTTSGFGSVLAKIGEPHSGQKPRWVLPPRSLGESWKRSEPCKSLKAPAGTITKDENGPPLDRWQSRQWQRSITTGSAAAS
jgi:hypothetical protein